jgi:RimJ/RimL family protein N-acetyltransferase
MVKLVRFEDRHREDLLREINNPEIIQMLPHLDLPYTPEKAYDWIQRSKVTEGDVLMHVFAIEVDGKFAGDILLYKHAPHNYEVGYWIARPFWNKGCATEAVRQITDFGFNKLKLVRIQAHVFEGNPASEKVLLKNGFEYEGLIKKDYVKNGISYNTKMFAKVI